VCSNYSIDATNSSGYGRMVNDAKHGNFIMKKIIVGDEEHLCLFANDDTRPGDQLLYNYGDDPARLFLRNPVSYSSLFNLKVLCYFKYCLHVFKLCIGQRTSKYMIDAKLILKSQV